MYTKSVSTYYHHQVLTPTHRPSKSSTRKVRNFNRVRDGKCFVIFEKRQATNLKKGIKTEYAIVMFDEMQLKWSVKWSTQMGDMIGLKVNSQGLKYVLYRPFVL